MMVFLVLAACLLVLAGRLYCFFAHPEWTVAIQRRELWWLWLLASVCMAWALDLARRRD